MPAQYSTEEGLIQGNGTILAFCPHCGWPGTNALPSPVVPGGSVQVVAITFVPVPLVRGSKPAHWLRFQVGWDDVTAFSRHHLGGSPESSLSDHLPQSWPHCLEGAPGRACCSFKPQMHWGLPALLSSFSLPVFPHSAGQVYIFKKILVKKKWSLLVRVSKTVFLKWIDGPWRRLKGTLTI